LSAAPELSIFRKSPQALAIDEGLPPDNHERMVHKTEIVAQLADLASAVSGFDTRNGIALSLTSRARALGGAENLVAFSSPEESKFPRAHGVSKPTSKGRFRAHLLDTQMRAAPRPAISPQFGGISAFQ
jgi:hypothetical protein